MDNKNELDINELVKKVVENVTDELKEVTSELKEEIESIRKELREELDTIKSDLKSPADSIESRGKEVTDEPGDDHFPFEPPARPDVPPFASPFRNFRENFRHFFFDEDSNFDEHFGFGEGGTEKTYDYKDFTSVYIGGTFKIKITQSDAYSIIVKAKDSLFSNITVSEDGDHLNISHSRHLGWKAGLSRPEITITMPELKRLRLSGATSTAITGFKTSDLFTLNTSGACGLIGDITAGKIDFDISGATHIKLSGSTPEAIIKASGASNLELREFVIERAAIKLSGASNIAANLTGRLDARISGTSNLYWRGDPVMGDIRTSGLARITRE